MALYKSLKTMEWPKHTAIALLRISGPSLEKFSTQIRLQKVLDKPMILSTTKVMLSLRLESMIRSLMWIWAMEYTVNCLATTERITWRQLISSVCEKT